MPTRRPYRKTLGASCSLMLVALLWLTVALPFVYSAQQAVLQWEKGISLEEDNPLGDTNEEKAGGNTLAEYLHDMTLPERPLTTLLRLYKCHTARLLPAPHPEYVSPPPEV